MQLPRIVAWLGLALPAVLPLGARAAPGTVFAQTSSPPTAGSPSANDAPAPTSPPPVPATPPPFSTTAPSSADANKATVPPPAPVGTPAPVTGSRRNNNIASAPQNGQSAPAGLNGGPSVSYGGPQTDTAPVSGSTLRDSGGGTGGTPLYSSDPSNLGGPINGTANAYPTGVPYQGAVASPGAVPSGNRNNLNSFTRQPLGGAAYTRDQNGNFGGRGGYTAQGVYNGTGAQQIGQGYGSAYAPSGRPIGGLLGTNVDATGPLRPFIPLNTGTIARPNSGYGIPNGSRPTTMDGRGVQRVN